MPHVACTHGRYMVISFTNNPWKARGTLPTSQVKTSKVTIKLLVWSTAHHFVSEVNQLMSVDVIIAYYNPLQILSTNYGLLCRKFYIKCYVIFGGGGGAGRQHAYLKTYPWFCYHRQPLISTCCLTWKALALSWLHLPTNTPMPHKTCRAALLWEVLTAHNVMPSLK